jgi:transcriptional regulator, propionate catabolism operon regulatory protein
MINNDIRIGLVHASQELINEALRLAKLKNYDIIVAPFSIDAAIPAGRQMENDGIDVIISRRFTASVLRKHIHIPVLAVPVTFFDVYQSIWGASKKWKTILVPLYRGSVETEKIVELKNMIDAEILYYEYDDQKEMEAAIRWGLKQGCQGVVGGPNTKSLALKWGMECEEITSSSESIRFTLDEAFWVAIKRKQENEQNQLYKTIVNMSVRNIIAVDQSGAIRISNEQAKKLLNIRETHNKDNNIKDVLHSKDILNAIKRGSLINYHVEKIDGKQYLIEYHPVELENKSIGGIITIQDTESVIRAENEIRRSIARGLIAKYSLDEFVYNNPDTGKLIGRIKKYADTESTILITGPTGTGKEIIAHSIHRLSKRKSGPFVSINCASIPEQLLESELFGYEEGSFTGARRGGKLGLFEIAHKGTIFLDEIGSMPLSLQGRLLRVLQEREIMRIGADKLIPVDVRVLAATNEDLRHEVLSGKFREDLFFRINVLSLQIPPLNKRIEDIPCLVQYLVNKLSQKHNMPILEIPKSCAEKLMLLSWPGNVRELSNFIERLIVLCQGVFSIDIFQQQYVELADYSQIRALESNPSSSVGMLTHKKRQDHKVQNHEHILKILQENKFNKALTARKLGMSRMTLWRKLKNCNVS